MSAPFPDNCRRILDATQRITFNRGVSALRMDELAAELGMSKKTIYACYPSKEHLVAATIDAYYQHYEGSFQAVLDNTSFGFVDALQHAMRLGWEMNSALRTRWHMIFVATPQACHSASNSARRRWRSNIFQFLLAKGRDQGLLRSDLPLTIVEDILLEAIAYRLTPSNLRTKTYTLPEASTTFYQLLFTGLLSEEYHHYYRPVG